MFTHRKAHSKGFWEHSFTSEGKDGEIVRTLEPPCDVGVSADRPSQVIMGPGSKPSWHRHSKPPTTLVQVPFPHGFPMEHSSVSEDEPFTSHTHTHTCASMLMCSSMTDGMVERTEKVSRAHRHTSPRCNPGCIRRGIHSGTSRPC